MKDITICVIGFLILIPTFPILLQLKSEVNNGAFNKLIKIKHFSFMFCAPSRASVSKEGIALPIFISQLIGYVLSLVLGILNLLCYFVSKTAFKRMALVTCLILVAEAIGLVIFDMVLLRLSRSKKYFKRNKHQ